MIKKLLVTVAAAGALSVPLAGVASADPAPDNPGVPGNILGHSPGETFRVAAKLPGSTARVVRDSSDFNSPGEAIKEITPGHQP